LVKNKKKLFKNKKNLFQLLRNKINKKII